MPQTISTTTGPAQIRPLGPEDVHVVRELLSRRDGRQWDEESTNWFVQGLDPQRCRAWAAFIGDKPVGLTTTFLRILSLSDGDRRVAYWANLYVAPEHRDQMLYPRLPMAMLNALKPMGIDMLYAPVRIAPLAKAHLGLGFAKIGAMEVLVRPLRPARFLCKYKGLGSVARALAPAVDQLYRLGLAWRGARALADVRIEDGPIDQAPLGEIARLLADRSAERIAQRWSADQLQQRYRQTREGGSYRTATARSGRELSAAAIYRTAERGDGIRVGVIMDLAFAPGAERAAATVLRTVERQALADDCELLMYLDGLGPANRCLLQRRGFRTSPEIYEFLVWPKKLAAADAWIGDWNRWEFSFRDHDAF